jgi:hypothetical protein
MKPELEKVLENIISKHEALSLDDEGDRNKLIKALAEGLTPVEYSQVETIAKALFPVGEVDESFFDCELTIYTGLYNVSEAGAEEPILVDVSKKHMYDNSESEEEIDDGVDWER